MFCNNSEAISFVYVALHSKLKCSFLTFLPFVFKSRFWAEFAPVVFLFNFHVYCKWIHICVTYKWDTRHVSFNPILETKDFVNAELILKNPVGLNTSVVSNLPVPMVMHSQTCFPQLRMVVSFYNPWTQGKLFWFRALILGVLSELARRKTDMNDLASDLASDTHLTSVGHFPARWGSPFTHSVSKHKTSIFSQRLYLHRGWLKGRTRCPGAEWRKLDVSESLWTLWNRTITSAQPSRGWRHWTSWSVFWVSSAGGGELHPFCCGNRT